MSLSRFTYYEYLTYCRKHFNGITWYYDKDDAEEIDNLDLWEAVYEDLEEHGFAAVNTDL